MNNNYCISVTEFDSRRLPSVGEIHTEIEVLFYKNRKIVAKVVTVSSGGVRIYDLKKGTYAVRVRAANIAGFDVVTPHKVLRIR